MSLAMISTARTFPEPDICPTDSCLVRVLRCLNPDCERVEIDRQFARDLRSAMMTDVSVGGLFVTRWFGTSGYHRSVAIWRYKALPRTSPGGVKAGEVSAGTEAEARAALRRIGLQPLAVRPLRRVRSAGDATGRTSLASTLGRRIDVWLCSRRSERKAELFDALATLSATGVPLLEAVDTLAGPSTARTKSTRVMLVLLRERLREGASLADAMADLPAWFDAAEVAMARAGQASGELPSVLKMLAERRQRASGLSAKLAAALVYPLIVAVVTLVVVVFLSTQTLPELARLLGDADVDVPALTRAVIALGQFVTTFWPWLLLGSVIAMSLIAGLARLWQRFGLAQSWNTDRFIPATCRRVMVAGALMTLAELVRSGVTFVDALRILAPTVAGLGSGGLKRSLQSAAREVEQGASASNALASEAWFDDELRRLVSIGETSGQLDDVLRRIGERYHRSAERMIARLTAFLEPAAIVVLAVAVGTVVMAAVLPLLKLQEIAR